MLVIPPTVVWLLISACSAVSLNFWTDVNLSIAFFIVFVSCAVCASQVMAVAVNLFPTSYRSMATSFIVMSGRIGSAAGSNAVGLLLKDHCAWIFYFAAGALICTYRRKIRLSCPNFKPVCPNLQQDCA